MNTSKFANDVLWINDGLEMEWEFSVILNELRVTNWWARDGNKTAIKYNWSMLASIRPHNGMICWSNWIVFKRSIDQLISLSLHWSSENQFRCWHVFEKKATFDWHQHECMSLFVIRNRDVGICDIVKWCLPAKFFSLLLARYESI